MCFQVLPVKQHDRQQVWAVNLMLTNLMDTELLNLLTCHDTLVGLWCLVMFCSVIFLSQTAAGW